jgi:hypothetical protein
MKAIIAMLLLLAAVLPAGAGERVILYAMLLENTPVELADGAKWQMDKGDCFPVVAYKESHTKLILQLAATSFLVPADKTRIVTEKELPGAIASYRTNVNTYINGFAARWRAKAEAANPEAPNVEATKPNAPKPEGANPAAAKPDGAKPEAAKSEGTKPGGAKAEGAKPEGVKAGGAKAEGTKAEGRKPE